MGREARAPLRQAGFGAKRRPGFFRNLSEMIRGYASLRTRRVETCDEVLTESLDKALRDVRSRYGANMQSWRWGEAHRAQHRRGANAPRQRRLHLQNRFDRRRRLHRLRAGKANHADQLLDARLLP